MMKIISFYLPQYHPIAENNNWWGNGFTEWTNVARGKPLFPGHHQPHIPADLGFYDLRMEETRIAQAELASQHGISGFCYYHYWFNGKLLLERPFNEVLRSGRPDFPFSLCWANENWTRTWEGTERAILMEQKYESYDPVEHMEWLEKAFADRRYIRINDKPLFLVYRPDDIPKIRDIIKIWRKILSEKGYPGIYICSVKNFKTRLSDEESIALGFDAVVDFQPNPKDYPVLKWWNFARYILPRIFNQIILNLKAEHVLRLRPVVFVYDYGSLARNAIKKPRNVQRSFPCVIPGWDNTPRKKVGATVIQNNDADVYKRWLGDALERVSDYPEEEQVVFVNAWNEWAEGCHLEPDLKNGKKFLEATRTALEKFQQDNQL
jgi:lipopolysaccharide biosynthesis protein